MKISEYTSQKAKTQLDKESTERLLDIAEAQRLTEDELKLEYPDSLQALAGFCERVREIKRRERG